MCAFADTSSLAWAELFLGLGMTFRRFDFELFETDESDVVFKHDYFVAETKSDSKGVQVLVK